MSTVLTYPEWKPSGHRVIKIDHVEPPFFVYTVWTNGETRRNDIGPVIEEYEAAGSDLFSPLRDWATFNKVTVSDTRTIQWENVIISSTVESGRVISGPLDMDPDVLYAEGELVKSGEGKSKKVRES